MTRIAFVFFLLNLWALALSAQPLAEAKPEQVHFSGERLQRIDHLIQTYVDSAYIPGGAALIARHGKIIYYKAFGYADMDTRKPLQRDAIFRIASQTKAITSVAVMMLYEEGRFLLDDPISKYIPAFKNPRVLNTFTPSDTTFTTIPARREITIRDLLTHTSGIGYAGIGTAEANAIYAKNQIPSGIGTPDQLLSETMSRLGTLPLFFQPGERWMYGLNTDVLGHLVEVVSGMPLDEFFQKRIFEPLGMNDTWFYLPPDKQDRLMRLHTENREKKSVPYPSARNLDPDFQKMPGKYFSGGAGLASTLYDYAVFLQMLINGGTYNGKQILSPAIVRMMTSNQIGDLNLGAKKFGLGFGLTTDAEAARLPPSAGSFDWGGAFATTYWADPKEGIVALFYTQKYPHSYGELATKFRVLTYQAITELKKGE